MTFDMFIKIVKMLSVYAKVEYKLMLNLSNIIVFLVQ